MSGYTTIVVGTDGSDSSLRAVDKAGQIAAGSGAKVVVATAYFPQSEDQRAADVLKDEGYKMAGNAPIYAILREAKDRALAAGATEVITITVDGSGLPTGWSFGEIALTPDDVLSPLLRMPIAIRR